MTVESSTYISGLNTSLPAGGDQKAEGDDHIRLLKSTIKNTFPNITGAVNPTQTELNYVVGATSAIQTQINGKIGSASPTFTGPAAFGGAVTGITDLTTTGNAILGDASSDTLNVGAGGIQKDASGNTGFGGAAASTYRVEVFGALGVTNAFAPSRFDILNTNANAATRNWAILGSQNVFGDFVIRQSTAQGGDPVSAGVDRLSISSTNGTIADGAGNELGFKGLPAASVTTGAFVAADRGKCVNATGGVTVPNSTMSATDVVYIDNQSGGAITITATITTLKLAGTTGTGNRTLAADGFATVRFRSGTVAVISGPGVS